MALLGERFAKKRQLAAQKRLAGENVPQSSDTIHRTVPYYGDERYHSVYGMELL